MPFSDVKAWPLMSQNDTLRTSPDLGRTTLPRSCEEDVLQSFGVAYAIEASNLDQLTAQRSLQCFIAFKVEGLTTCFDRRPCSLKSLCKISTSRGSNSRRGDLKKTITFS